MFRVEGLVKCTKNTIIMHKRQSVSSGQLNGALSAHASIRKIEMCRVN